MLFCPLNEVPSRDAHLNKLTCPSLTVEHANIILCGWNAVEAIGVGLCEESTLVCRKLLNGSIVDSGVEFAAVAVTLLVEKTRTAL
jgi:hypothetical protein